MQIDRNQQLTKAREAAASVLQGQSPQERGQQKLLAALEWVYRWGSSSPTLLEQVGGAQRSGLAARLVRAGLLQSTRTEAGGVLKGVPVTYLTLTSAGLEEVERHREVLLPYATDATKVKQQLLRHDYLAQALTLKRLASGQLTSYQTERELARQSQPGIKQPDVVWRLQSGIVMGVEVELSAKWGRDFDGFVAGCVAALTGVGGQPSRLNAIGLFTDSPAILRRYKDAMQSGKSYGIWAKDARGHWHIREHKKVPTQIEGKFVCALLD